MTSASDIMRFRLRLGAWGVDGSAFLAISASNSLQKSSAIQKISVTLLSVIMIGYLLFFTSKILIIINITKRIGSLIKLPIYFCKGRSYPELALESYPNMASTSSASLWSRAISSSMVSNFSSGRVRLTNVSRMDLS